MKRIKKTRKARKAKKTFVLMLAITLILNLFNFNPKVEASTNGHTADDALNWVKSKLDIKVGSGECVALIAEYYLYLGHQSPKVGSAIDYASSASSQPSGWQILQGVQPQKGDILIYSASAGNIHGHVAIYESDYVTYHQNYLGRYVRKITNHYTQMYDEYLYPMPYWGVIRPDFEERFIPDGSKQDIGNDFIAYITPKSNSNLAVQVTGTDNGSNVNLTQKNENSQSQKWYFNRQSDGSYTIMNMESNTYLDIENTGNTDYEKVQIWSGGTNDKQAWFIYSYNGAYRLVPRSSQNDLRALDIGDDIIDGAKLQIYKAVSNNNEWQTFNIVKDLGEKQNIGDKFVALIVPKTNSDLAVEVVGTDNGSNVQLGTIDNSDAQKWYFKRQSDGSYLIQNEYASKYLDIYGTGNTNGENVQIWSGGTNDKQAWFIYSYNGGYRLVPRSSPDNSKALDIGDDIIDGANLQIHYYVSSSNSWQTFDIIKETQGCAHENVTIHPAIESTCLTHGHAEYTTCDICGEVISGSAEELPLADHDYGQLIERVDPIHTSTTLKDGVEAHYRCSICGKLFNQNKEEVTEEDLIIEAPEHIYKNDWVSDNNYHWKECDCGKKIEQESHHGGEATCVSKAKCEVCGQEYGELDPTNHQDTEIINAVEATTETEGYTGDVYCPYCNKIVKKGEIIPIKTTDNEDQPVGETSPNEQNKDNTTLSTNENNTTETTIPQTSDNSNITLWISLLIVSGISIIIILRKWIKRKPICG